MMRHTSVYENANDRQSALDATRGVLSQFGNLIMKSGEVRNGFPDPVPLESLEGNFRVEPKMLEENLVFGSPDEVIDKLEKYQEIGVDAFIYYASMGLGMAQQQRSLQLFIEHVMPAFNSFSSRSISVVPTKSFLMIGLSRISNSSLNASSKFLHLK